MTSKRNWETVPDGAAADERLFFDEAEWQLLRARPGRPVPQEGPTIEKSPAPAEYR